MKKTVLMTALAALVLSSCVKEKLEEPVSLRYALDDGTGITNAFIRVEDGYVRHYTTDAIFVLGGKKIWRCAGNEFSEQSHSQYSLYGEKMEFRQQSNLGSGGRLKNGVLTVLGRRWTAIDGFSPDYYSSIVFPSGDQTVGSDAQNGVALKVSVHNPLPCGVLRASSTATWVSFNNPFTGADITVNVEKNQTGAARSATVYFDYFKSDDAGFMMAERASFTLNQEQGALPAPTIVLTPAGVTKELVEDNLTFDAVVTNPIPGTTLTASTTATWITNISVSAGLADGSYVVDYHLAQNLSLVPRTDSIKVVYGDNLATEYFKINQKTTEPYDLSGLNGTSNCYIISRADRYCFPLVKGCDDENEPITGAVSGELLWESYGTDTAPEVGALINPDSFSFLGNKLVFSTSSSNSVPQAPLSGNALVAVKDAGGKILWSWHLWICDNFYPGTTAQKYKNSTPGMMDRNLGALSAAPGDVQSLGLLYQWGRKDPFMGPRAVGSYDKALSTITWPSPATEKKSIAFTVENPTTFIAPSTTNGEWSTGQEPNRWKNTKTMYDPCPAGWMVPEGGVGGVWESAIGTGSNFYHIPDECQDDTNKGANMATLLAEDVVSTPMVWYPYVGRQEYNQMNYPGVFGCYWSNRIQGSGKAYYFLVAPTSYYVQNTASTSMFWGQSVRCIQQN